LPTSPDESQGNGQNILREIYSVLNKSENVSVLHETEALTAPDKRENRGARKRVRALNAAAHF
jgi:hypothetical protein